MRLSFVSDTLIPDALSGVRPAQRAAGRADNAGDEGPFHFQIGVVGVSVRSVCIPALRDFRALYRGSELGTAPRQAIEIDVVHMRSRSLLGRRFAINADGTRRFVVASEKAVLPHIEWAINWQIMLYLPRYYEIHAGVVEYQGQGVIFPAVPGSGKSTLTAGMLRRGWRYLSDEFALIDPETLELHPYPKAVCLKEGSFGVLETLGLQRRERSAYLKGKKGLVTFVRPEEFGPLAVGSRCPIRHIVFCRHEAGRRPTLQPMSPADAVLRLTRLSFNFQKFRTRGIEILTSVVRQARCYELVTGPIDESCDLVARAVHGDD
ncbi:MAG: hypothetical protein V3W34_15585 [Phycisphaerae bacterium]